MATTMERPPPKMDDLLYKGHKVVAMPSSAFGGKTVHEWVSSKNRTDDSSMLEAKHRVEDPLHRRSLSAGRASMRGRDILKETYDRMGITSPRQHPWDEALANVQSTTLPLATPNSPQKPGDITRNRSVPSAARDTVVDNSDHNSLLQRDRKETFQMRYVSAAAMSRGRNDTREEDQKTQEQEKPKSRSLSRGRYRDWNWPPKKQIETDDPAVESIPVKNGVTVAKPFSAAAGGVVEVAQALPTTNIKNYFRPLEGPTCWAKRRAKASPVPSSPSIQDEKKEADEPPPPSPKKEFTPIKDRITALAATRRNNRNARQSPPTLISKSIHPPVIDIYEEAKRHEEEAKKYEATILASTLQSEDPNAGQPSTETVSHPSPAAVAAANAAADLVGPANRDNDATYQRSPLPTGRSVRSGGLATAFLAAIQSPKLSPGIQYSPSNGAAPFLEIASNEDSPGGVDANSIAMSSVSADDLSVSARGRNARSVERSKPVITPRKLNNGILGQKFSTMNGSPVANGYQQNTQTNVSMEAVERIVEERVQARLAEFEARSEGLLRQLESRMEEKHKARADALEAQVEQLANLISGLCAEQQSRDSGRE